MAALDNNPAPQDAVNSNNDGSAPIARKAGSRGDAAVIATLLPYLRPYVGRIALALGLIVAAKLANLYVPIALKQIVDQLNVEPSLLVLPVALLLAYGAS